MKFAGHETMIDYDGYRIAEPDALETPAMVVYAHKLDHNIAAMCELAGGASNLMVHVKTHKTEAIVRRQIDVGITAFKCATLKELEITLEAGAAEAILAYPQVQRRKVERLAGLTANFPDAQVYTIVSANEHICVLREVVAEGAGSFNVMIDVDAGMHRTGVSFEEAPALYGVVHQADQLVASGIHLYDGHEHFSDPEAREAAANRQIARLNKLKAQLEEAGMPVPRIVAGCTFTFPYYARTEGMHGSPGTCTYWDLGYGNTLPNQPYEFAALVLTQVVDRDPGHHTITTDLGNKAIPADPPLHRRATLLGHEDANLLIQNEEHGVFALRDGDLPAVGTYLLAIPWHVCPTATKYPGSYVLDDQGALIDFHPHSGRDRY